MAVSINGTLTRLAGEFYINHGSPEAIQIDKSVNNLKEKLWFHFDRRISKIIEFGSYKRDTILPRRYDTNSDVDLMVVFNHDVIQVTPETYRKYLLDFANNKYTQSEVYKTAPTITLELNHIQYDLVPAYEQNSWYTLTPTLHIPASNNTWISTDPVSFNDQLTNTNKNNRNLIKPVIRLLKAWNAKTRYPYSSFELEQEITGINYYWGCNSLEDYFFTAIDGLSSYYKGSFSPNPSVLTLKSNAQKVKDAMKYNDEATALRWLAHILPM